MGTECNINQFIDKYPYTISLDTATTLIEIISEDTTLFSEEFRQCMIEKINGKLATDTVSNDVVAILPAGPIHGKQTMLYPENYFTEGIWRGILDGEAREGDVYMPIVAVLVRVGLSRPQETFWGSLVATLQWGSCNPNFDAAHVRDTMKRMWKTSDSLSPRFLAHQRSTQQCRASYWTHTLNSIIGLTLFTNRLGRLAIWSPSSCHG